eukprot:3237140-Amphidinium_carterae.1
MERGPTPVAISRKRQLLFCKPHKTHSGCRQTRCLCRRLPGCLATKDETAITKPTAWLINHESTSDVGKKPGTAFKKVYKAPGTDTAKQTSSHKFQANPVASIKHSQQLVACCHMSRLVRKGSWTMLNKAV